ncbi:MAG TPA: hypothetical protein VGM06_26755 [Polyangiaceae bacterium]|jgi:hypothetical protein
MTPRQERRRLRSDDPLVALHHQLASVRVDGDIDTVVVADDAGLVVAGVGAWAACEELAAYAPLLAEPRTAGASRGAGAEEPGDSRIAELRGEVDVRSLDVGGQRVLLCVRGGARRDQAAERAAGGVARILGQA